MKEKSTPMLTRKSYKRTATEADRYEQTTIPAMATAKRQKVEQIVEKTASPAKVPLQRIAEIQGKKEFTLEEAIVELRLTG